MSGDEPGYVPPDHKTTTEFDIPMVKGDEAAPGEPAREASEETLVDRPSGPAAGEATIQDVPAEASPTMTDVPAGTGGESSGGPGSVPLPPYAMGGEMGAEVGGEEAAPAQPPPAVPEQGPWTAQFGAEQQAPPEENGRPASPGVAQPAAAVPMASRTPPAEAGPVPAPVPEAAPEAMASPAGPPAPDTFPPPTPPSWQPAPAAASPSGGLPPAPQPETPPAGARRRPVLLGAAIALLLVVGAGAVVTVIAFSGDEGGTGPGAQPAASASPSPEGTQPPAQPGATEPPASEAPPVRPEQTPPPDGRSPQQPPSTVAPVGPVVPGKGITYQLVQQDPGYFEGELVITNRSDRPVTDWKITFSVPGANVKNIWGGRLVRTGSQVEIRNLENAPAIRPGAEWEVQYGAEGAAKAPQKCRLNGEPCGF